MLRFVSADSDQLAESLRKAIAAVAAADVPDDLREVAFAKSIEYLLPEKESSSPPGGRTTPPRNPPPAGEGLAAIASKLDVQTDEAERVYELDGDTLHLVIGKKSLPTSKKASVQELAYLVAAGRQAAGLDETTTAETLRTVCEDFDVFDGNFAKSLTQVSGEGLRMSGPARDRAIKVNKAGYEKAGEIVKRLAAGDAK
jgi:hypothetical protein